MNWLVFVGAEDIAVMNSATVKDLKLAIKKKVIEFEQSKMGHRHISWFIIFFFFFTLKAPIMVFGDLYILLFKIRRKY